MFSVPVREWDSESTIFSCRKNENGKNKRKTIKLNMDEKKTEQTK